MFLGSRCAGINLDSCLRRQGHLGPRHSAKVVQKQKRSGNEAASPPPKQGGGSSEPDGPRRILRQWACKGLAAGQMARIDVFESLASALGAYGRHGGALAHPLPP